MYKQMAANTMQRVRKSEKLSEAEATAFTAWVSNQPTKVDAALLLHVERTTLDRVLAFKSGAPETIKKIRKVLCKDAGVVKVKR